MSKIAVVTGAGSGVGRASAKALAAAGWSVTLVGRRESALAETADMIEGDPLVAAGDISQPEDVDRIFVAVKEK